MKIGGVIFTKDCDNWRLKNSLGCNLEQVRQPDEVLIIDFGSLDIHKKEYKETITNCINPSIVRFIEITKNTKLFHPARMANKAILETTSDYLIFTDVDALPSSNAYKIAEQVFTENLKHSIMCSRLDLKENSNNPDVNFVKDFNDWWEKNGSRPNHSAPGSFQGFPVKWLKEVGGYDEHYIGWGFYDMDIRDRAERAGLIPVWINDRGVRLMHIWHAPRSYRQQTDMNRSWQRFRAFKGVKLNEDINNKDNRIYQKLPGGGFVPL